jgi:hypothetical protein
MAMRRSSSLLGLQDVLITPSRLTEQAWIQAQVEELKQLQPPPEEEELKLEKEKMMMNRQPWIWLEKFPLQTRRVIQ